MEIAVRERGVFQLRLRLQRCERLRPLVAVRTHYQLMSDVYVADS